MIGVTATATELQNNFGRYLNLVIGGEEVVITKNGKEVGQASTDYRRLGLSFRC